MSTPCINLNEAPADNQNNVPAGETALGAKSYAAELLRANIGKRVLVILNFAGNFPPEKRTFTGEIIEVGIDFFILDEGIAKNQLLAYFVNLAYLSFLDYPNLPGKKPPALPNKDRKGFSVEWGQQQPPHFPSQGQGWWWDQPSKGQQPAHTQQPTHFPSQGHGWWWNQPSKGQHSPHAQQPGYFPSQGWFRGQWGPYPQPPAGQNQAKQPPTQASGRTVRNG